MSPSAASVRTGASQTFTAAITGAAAGVTWSVNGIAGGDALVGTIDSGGVYTAPGAVPSPATVTIRATSTSSPGANGTAAATIVPPLSLSSVTPSQRRGRHRSR